MSLVERHVADIVDQHVDLAELGERGIRNALDISQT